MRKSELTVKRAGLTGRDRLRRRLATFVVGLVAAAGMALAGPVASQAAEFFEVNQGGWSSVGSEVNLGVIAPGSSYDQQFRMRSNTTVFSNTQRAGTFTFSDTNFEYISNCSGTSYSWVTHSAFSFTVGKRQGGFSGSFDCAWTARLKNNIPPGVYATTLSWAQSSNWNLNGSTQIRYTVAEEAGAAVRIYGPSNETTSVDFGQVGAGDSLDQTIRVKNTGSVNMTGAGRNITGSGDFTVQSTTCGATLAPLAECYITVRLSPSSVGVLNGTLNVTSGSGHARSIGLTGEGMPGIADISVTPMSHDYGDIATGHPASRAFTVTNNGNVNVNLNLSTSDSAVIFRDGGSCGATLGVGNSCTVVVKFDPSASGPAAQSGSFTIEADSPFADDPSVQTVNVTGNRVPPAPGYEVRVSGAEISEIDFGAVSLGGSGSRTIEIVNTGNMIIPNVAPTLTGPEASSYSISGNSCGATIAVGSSCTFTVTVNADRAAVRRATLNLTPGASNPAQETKSVKLVTNPAGLQIRNDITDNYQSIGSQKRWLETPTVNPGGALPADIVRVAFEVDAGVATGIEGVEIAGSTTTNDTAPGSGYQNIEDLLGGVVQVERKVGSSQALVTAAIPLNVTNMGVGNGQYGFENGTDWLCAINVQGGNMKTDNRRVWFRIRGTGGVTTAAVGSVVRFVSQNYGCPNNQGPGMNGARIVSIGGVNQPNNTNTAAAPKGAPATFSFTTRTKSDGVLFGDGGVAHSINIRIRNAKTGDMYRIVNGSYQLCGRPCTADAEFNNGGRVTFPTQDPAVQTVEIPGIPSRGRWIVEGSLRGTEQDLNRFYQLGVLRINDTAESSPTLTFGGTLGARPDTDEDYTITANVSDPADPVNALDSQGGNVQVIEWDLDRDPNNGPLGDGFEFRSEGDSTAGVPAADLAQAFSTVGKAPGPYKIRARVTDNGSLLSSETVAQSRVFEFDTTINTPPEPINDVIYLEADQDQPTDIDFRVDDVDGDDHRVDITPDGANTGSLGGNMNGPIGDNTKPYSWPADYTGTDTYEFTPTDDHKGTGPDGTLTVRVRPNTVIDQSSIAGAVLHPDVSDPANGFLGSTTTTEAEFEFSSPQTPVVAYECRHLLDGDVVEDWEECSDQSTGDIELEDLDDGLHRLEVRAVNDEGVEDGTPAFRTWRVDNTAPETEVRVGPPSNLPTQQPRYTNDSTPTYVFKATDAERSLQQYMTYECRVMWGPNAGNWIPCGSPSDTLGSGPVDIVGPSPAFGIVNPLPEGDYEIQVRATDEVGNLGPAMTEVVRIDITPPETALASGPEGLINTRNLEYVLGSSQGQSTFLCKVEGQNVGVVIPLGPCPGPAADGSRPTFTVPADDIYVLTAVAVDPAQNQDTSPLEVDFEVDATEPETTMDPEVDYGDGLTTVRRTQSRKVDVTFTGTDSRQLQGYQCRLDSNDDEAWEICESPQRFSGLPDGPHRLEIRARDEAGNVDSTPEVLEWVVDRTPPTTSITVAPDPITNDADPSFEFDVDEAISGAVCSLDGGTPVPCSSPFTLGDLGVTGGLDDGDHTVTVKSTDIAGNVEQAHASASWRQDTVAPTVAFTSRPGAYTPLGAVNFGWSVKDGDPPVLAPEVGAECAFDPADPDAIDASEWESCGRDLTIAEEDNENGAHTFAVRAIDEAGNVSAVVSHDWMVLGAKPNPPVIDDSSPVDGATTRVGTAYFAISHELEGTGALEALLCSIDGGTRTPCAANGANFEVEGLDDGPHTFSVVARDIAGNVSDPTVVSWEVQRGAPVTSIDFGPNGVVNTADATFEFSSDKDGTFECKVDAGEWEPCASPVDLINFDEGPHEFRVRAVSTVAPVGVKDPTPPVRKWTVDTVAPEVTIDSAPEGDVVSYDASIRFSSDDPTASFQCQLNDGLFVDCASPWNLSDLAAGQQTVTVRAVDAAGNMSATPAQAVWVVQDPSCPDGFEGTPPNCTEITPVEGPAITAVSTGGTLSLAALGSVDLPENQVKLEGKLGADGRWFIPAAGVKFEPVTQVIEDAIGPGTEVTVTISITATGDSWGLLPNGGGPAKLKLPVRADVDAKLGTLGLFPPGTECSLRPVTFDLNGTFDENAMTAHFEQPSVSFPKVTGCATFKEVVDDLLELPRDDIEFALDLALTVEQGSCPDGTTGTPPDCVAPPKRITLAKPAVKGTKKVRAGKAARYTVRVRNTGDAPASNAKVCLTAPRRFFRGKAQRCRTIKSIAAGKAVAPTFRLRAKKFKLRKNRKVNLKAVVTYRDGDGKSRKVIGRIKPRALKTGKVK